MIKIILITPGSPPTLSAPPGAAYSPDPVHLSKSGGDQVQWVCSQDFNVIMVYGTPFAVAKFTQASSRSGVPILTPDYGAQVYFKYLVEVGGQVADPGVIVDA